MRIDEVIARAGVIARRLARPLRPLGIIALVAGFGVWLMIALPLWDEDLGLAGALILFVLLAAPGGWLLLHHRWLERTFRKAEALVPDATAMGRGALDAATSRGRIDDQPRGRLRTAWTFYRRHLGPLRRQGTDMAQSAISLSQPFMPWVLITTGVALGLVLLVLVLVPVAVITRLVLLVN